MLAKQYNIVACSWCAHVTDKSMHAHACALATTSVGRYMHAYMHVYTLRITYPTLKNICRENLIVHHTVRLVHTASTYMYKEGREGGRGRERERGRGVGGEGERAEKIKRR